MFARRMERNNGEFDNTKWISVARMYYQTPDKVTSNNIDTRTYVMRKGDIAFEGHSNSEFKYGRFVANDIGDGVISELFPIYKHIDKYDLNYWKYAIQLESLMQSKLVKCIEISYTSSNKLDKDSFLKEKIPVASLAEQEKIGEYFSNLDHLITLHQRKLFEAKNNPKNGSKNFFRKIYQKLYKFDFNFKTYDWEQRKLGDVFDERSERASGNEELLSVTISNGVIRQIDSEKRNIASEDKSNYKVVKKGDVPYNSMRMWQGAVGTSDYDGIVSPAYTVLIPKNNCNGKFFMELFKKQPTLEIFKRWSQGLTSDTWNLKYPVLSTIPFMVPSVKEQEKIAEYFKSLDNLITLHQREVFYTLKHIFYRCCDTLLSGGL